MIDLVANFIADILNTFYKSFQTDKRKGIKTELKPITKKVIKNITK